MPDPTEPGARLRDLRAEPTNLWIRHSAILRPPEGLVWVDLALGTLGGDGAASATTGRRVTTPQDLVYLPPAADQSDRDELGEWCATNHVPTLVHHVVGSGEPRTYGDLSVPAVDLFTALLGDSLSALQDAAGTGILVWPVVSGLTDAPDLVAAGLDSLKSGGARRVVPIAVSLSPTAGRRLTETFGDRLFESVFHSGDADLRPIAQALREREMEFLAPRPSLPSTSPLTRQLATELALIGELWSVSEESPARAQEFFRAAAWMETTRHDVASLIREGNLGIVPMLSERVVEVITEIGGGAERSTLLTELERLYTADRSTGTPGSEP